MHPLAASLDWDRHGQQAVELLRRLVQFDTSNPPGDERPCAEFLAGWLREAGVEPRLLEAEEGRANLVARLRGGQEPPLLLGGHLDVVPAEAHRWTHPPFAGEIHEGSLWGRGTVDMKHMVAMSAVAVRILAEHDPPLRRDVILAAVADEEVGCDLGSRFLVEEHPEEVRAGYALGEVGGATLHLAGRPVYPVEVAERGLCWIRATARGPAGHGSVPREDNPVVRLAAFLARLGPRALPVHVSPPVERFVEALADLQGGPARVALRGLLNPRLSGVVTGRLIRNRSMARLLEAVVRNTASPTQVRAGHKTNVIPPEATAELDGRIAVGSTAGELVRELRRLAGPGIELEVIKAREPTATSPDTELFSTIRSVVAEHHPGAAVVPTVMPGLTDANSWSRLGTRCYGFAPLRLPAHGGPAFHELFHAVDERIPIDGFLHGLRMLVDTVLRFATADTGDGIPAA